MAAFSCCFFSQSPTRVQPGTKTQHQGGDDREKERDKKDNTRDKDKGGKPKQRVKRQKSVDVRKSSPESKVSEASASSEAVKGEPTPARRFRYKELEIATANFNTKLVLGEGGFGKVYQGRVEGVMGAEGGMNVAIKKLNPESIQGYEQWINEVLLLERLHHANLIHLIGYCAEENEALLVYTLYPRGSLDKVLFDEAASMGKSSGDVDLSKVLTWSQRMRVAQDAAKGLAYLHTNNVIHRDFKPSNILLSSSDDVAAVLTDFGLARAGPDGNDTDAHISTRIMGTLGYLDPTYLETGRLTYKSDTFAFGIMLLELLTGKREGTDRRLSTWVRRWHQSPGQDDIVFHVDWRLKGQYSRSDAAKVANLANKCLSVDQNDRPELSIVVEELLSLKT